MIADDDAEAEDLEPWQTPTQLPPAVPPQPVNPDDQMPARVKAELARAARLRRIRASEAAAEKLWNGVQREIQRRD